MLALLTLAASAAAAAGAVLVVDLQTPPLPSPATVLAVQVCAGLMNRDAAGPAVYTLMHGEDAGWLAAVAPGGGTPATAPALVAECLSAHGSRVIRYNFSSQQELVPNLVTLAAVLAAVPLEDGSPLLPPAPVVAFDAVDAWAGFAALDATRFMYATFARNTTGLAKMNPGWDVHGFPLDPPLTGLPDLSLADFIVKQSLFNFFLLWGCVNGTAEHALMEEMGREGPWRRPMAVFGYDDTLPVAGDIFEAETTCTSARDMGQVATVGVNNLAYFSRAPPITAPIAQNPAPPRAFNASKTYLALVVGDGDNIAFVKSSRWTWMEQRLAACAAGGGACFPLSWTISPHLLYAAPAMLRRFVNASLVTRADYFVLPPSGCLYAYPSLMSPANQAAFVAATEADATLLNASASVAWEFVGTWAAAIADYFPRYAVRGVVRALFATNVPYLAPVVDFSPGEYYKVLRDGAGGATVLFRPSEWRGTSGSANPVEHPFLLSAAEMALLINALPAGTATHIYMTSDGGAVLQDFFDLVALLGDHVEVVDAGTLAAMALAADAAAADAPAAVVIAADVRNATSAVPNFASHLTQWSYGGWTQPLSAADRAAYPFLTTIELFTATGGCYLGFPGCTSARDLLADPTNRSSAFAFDPLLNALGNITASGLRPYIVTGNVPVAFSASPKIGGFGFNSNPPSDLAHYSQYIGALADAAVARFGLAAVRGWKWGVFTEYNNPDWLQGDAESFFALYDFTACALERALGAGHVDIGAHACTQCGSWDSMSLLDHVAGAPNASKNYCTGAAGAPMSFLSLSFYETQVGGPGDLGWLARDVLPARRRAAALGLSLASFGVDEGRLLQGVDALPLASRAVGATYQATWDALFASELIAGGFDYYSRWAFNSGGSAVGANENVDPVSTNVARLFARLAGMARLPSTNASASAAAGAAPAAIVNGLVAFDAPAATLRAVVFRHHVDAADAGASTAVLRVCGFAPPAQPPRAVAGTVWRVDDGHAQWWGAFQADVTRNNWTSFTPGWSPSCEAVTLTNATERAAFAMRVPAYQALAALVAEPASATLDAGGCLAFDAALAGHAVLLAEFVGVAAAA